MVKCQRSVVGKCCREVLWRSVMEECQRSVVGKCCREVLWRSVMEECCKGKLWRMLVKSGCGEVL